MFSLEKLKVYDRALASVASLVQLSADWDKRHAVVAHERMEAYQCSLKVVSWFHALPGGTELSTRWFRQLDKAVTSVVLNIAEGNGRRMEADHRRFLELAESSVMKVNTYIQLIQRSGNRPNAVWYSLIGWLF
jgi:four helix bundle protein